jgi:putative DNA primase/helicase
MELSECRHRWFDLLSYLGVESRFLRNKHGPCPLCGGKDRFRWDNKEGRGTWICSHCGAGDGAELAMRVLGTGFKDLIHRIGPFVRTGIAKKRWVTGEIMSDAYRRKVLNEMWRSAHNIWLNDPVDLYLCRRLCGSNYYKGDLRTLDKGPALAMLAKVRDQHGKPISIHRTFLTNDGRKQEGEFRKLMPGKLPESVAVRLAMPEHDGVLGVAEGIETALSVMKLFGLPCWATLSEGFLRKFIPPNDLEALLVFGDNDYNYVGQAAAYELARKLSFSHPGLRIVVQIPECAGEDWNDVLIREELKNAGANGEFAEDFAGGGMEAGDRLREVV